MVAEVIDGDTLRLKDGRKLRLIGINSPELARRNRPVEPMAEEARQALQQILAADPNIDLTYGRDRYDRYQRLLAHAFSRNGLNLQASLLRRGLAAHIVVPPNDRHAKCYHGLEKEAQKAGRGMWAHERFAPLDADNLDGSKHGYYRVTGRVVAIKQQRDGLWFKLNDTLSLQIRNRDLKYFSTLPLRSLRNHRIEVHGWLFPYGKGLKMQLRHADALQLLD